MANKERFMKNLDNQNIISVPVASATVIEKGDFVLMWRGSAITPSMLGDIYGSATAARREAANLFGGISQDASAAGDTLPVSVDIGLDGIYALDQCTAGAMSVADLVGFCATSIAGGLWGLGDQTVEADCSYPIAVVVQEKAATGTRILAKMLPNRVFNFVHSYPICDTESNMSYAG